MSPLIVQPLMQAHEILNSLHAKRLVNNTDKERLRTHQHYPQLLNKLVFLQTAGLLTRENSSAIITQLLDFEDTDNHLEFILHMLKRAYSLKELDILKLISGLAKPAGNALSFLSDFCVDSAWPLNGELGDRKKKLFGSLVLLKKLGYLNETAAYALLETISAAKSMKELSQLVEKEFKAKLISSNDKAYALWSTKNINQTLKVLSEHPNVEELLYTLMEASDAKRIVKMLTLHKDRLFSGQYLGVNSFFLFNFTQVERLCRCLLKIHEANLLPKIGVDNFISLCSENPKLTMDALLKLDKNKLLDGEEGQANLNFLLSYPAFIASLTEALIILQKSEMLTGPQGTFCREFIVSNQRSSAGIMAQQMANGLKLLYLNSLQDDIGRLKNTFAPYNLAYELVELKKANLLDFKVYLEKFSDPKHFAAVVKNIHRLKLEIDKESELLNHLIEIDELMVLKIISGFIVQSKLDNKPAKLKALFNLYLVLLRQSRDGQDYASCFWLTLNLLKKDLSPYLDKQNQEKYYTKLLEFSHQPSIYLKMRRLLVILEGSLHKKEFFELVFDDVALADFINYFSQVRLLDKNNEAEYLNFFKQYRYSLVAVKNQLSRLPPGLLNQHFFAELKRVCYLNQNDPLPAMQLFIRVQSNLFRPSLNDKQSTHKASVHASASHSAQRLKELYHTKLRSCSAQKEILALLEQDNSLKSEAIREFFKQSQHFTTRDSTSGISLPELLAYCWLAIHDDSQRQSSLEDARTVILEGLYEMQRGGNLNEQGGDNGLKSSPICFGGCFHKLIEKLVGVHPVANILYLDHKTAGLKFKALVLASLDNYLQDKINGDIQAYNELIDKLNQDKTLPEDIWALLKLNVENSLLEEFGSLYPNPAENTDFMGIISTYEWIDTSPILDKYPKRSVLIGNKNTFFYAEKNSPEAVNSSINGLDDPNESERKRQRLA